VNRPAGTGSLPDVHPDGMNDAWDIAQQCKDNIDPELETDADFQEYTQGRKKD
jgi:hypothetical protein